MKSRFTALGLLLAASVANPLAADASEFCNAEFSGFADELDRLADKYDTIKTDAELCQVMRSTGVPLYQSIADRTVPLAGKCPRGAEALEYSRSTLQTQKARVKEVCDKAGM